MNFLPNLKAAAATLACLLLANSSTLMAANPTAAECARRLQAHVIISETALKAIGGDAEREGFKASIDKTISAAADELLGAEMTRDLTIVEGALDFEIRVDQADKALNEALIRMQVRSVIARSQLLVRFPGLSDDAKHQLTLKSQAFYSMADAVFDELAESAGLKESAKAAFKEALKTRAASTEKAIPAESYDSTRFTAVPSDDDIDAALAKFKKSAGDMLKGLADEKMEAMIAVEMRVIADNAEKNFTRITEAKEKKAFNPAKADPVYGKLAADYSAAERALRERSPGGATRPSTLPPPTTAPDAR